MRAVFSKIVTALLGAALLVAAGQALACDTGCPPPAPPSPPVNPAPPCNCGNNSHSSSHTNVDVNVNVNARVSAFGFAGSSVSYGGGYGNWSQAQGIPSQTGLNVETGQEMAESYAEQETYTRSMVIEASCIDDTGVPHPASQLSPDRDIDNRYVGEVYRCIAGTHMQVTMASYCDTGPIMDHGPIGGGIDQGAADESASSSSSQSRSYSSHGSSSSSGMMSDGGDATDQGDMDHGQMDEHGIRSERHEHFRTDASESHTSAAAGCHLDVNHINFDGGKTLSCQKGEALWFEGGQVTCKAQIAQRQCNERSLLRRFGTGVKVMTLTMTERVVKQRQMASRRSSGSTMIFDGGVGGFVQ